MLRELLAENGTASMMRLMSLLTCLAAITLAFMNRSESLVLGMLGLAFSAKIGQKLVEGKNGHED